jgi:hypothetical protein
VGGVVSGARKGFGGVGGEIVLSFSLDEADETDCDEASGGRSGGGAVAHAAEHAVVGLCACTSLIQVTHGLKAPGFTLEPIK